MSDKETISQSKTNTINNKVKYGSFKILSYLRNYFIRDLVVFIIFISIYYLLKYAHKLWKIYPRTIWYNNYLEIASKYEKSTGLDLELADKLSEALTNYVKTPSKILNTIKSKYKEVIIDRYTSDDDENILSYIMKELYKKYNTNNNLYNLLRKFVEYAEIEFDEKTDKRENDEAENSIISSNKYLRAYYMNIEENKPVFHKAQDIKILNNVVITFIENIKKRKSIPFDKKLEKDKNMKVFFDDILRTKSSNINSRKSGIEILRNIFFRNVLYVIIYYKKEDISFKGKTSKNIIIDNQLEKLEKSNILSYINPEIYSNKSDEGRELFKEYGMYLHIKIKNKLIPFKRILKNENILPNFIIDNITNIESFNSEEEIRKRIDDRIRGIFSQEIIGNKIDIYKYLTYDKKGIFPEIIRELERYESDNFKRNEYRKNYEEYKKILEENRGKKYDSGNYLINEKYEFKIEYKGTPNNKIKDKYNNAKVNENDSYVLDLFNYMIIFNDFFEYLEKGDKLTGIQYDDIVKYYYFFESFTMQKIYDTSKLKDIYIIEDKEKRVQFLRKIKRVLKLVLYKRDIDIINVCLLSSIILKDKDAHLSGENIKSLAKYYLSLIEIKLAQNFIRDINYYKEIRTYYNVLKNFILPSWKEYGYDVIYKKYIEDEWSPKTIKKNLSYYWLRFVEVFGDECSYFKDEELRRKIGLKCRNRKKPIEFREPFLGFLKPIINPIKEIPKIGKVITSFVNASLKLIKMVVNIAKILIYAITNPEKALKILLGIIFYAFFQIIISLGDIELGFKLGEWLMLAFLIIPWIFITLGKISIVGVLLIVITIIGIIIWVMDEIASGMTVGKYRSLISQFIYKWFYSCENSPFSWYKNSRYDLENKNKRGFYCSLSCGSNYRLSENGYYCERAPTNVPYYCPQPLLYRAYIGEKTNGRMDIGSFFINDYPNILVKSSEEQAEFIRNYKKNKREYYESCMKNNNNLEYNKIGKNICAYGYDIKDNDLKKKIMNICKQTYCENGNYEDFCYKYENKDNKDILKFLESDNKMVEILKKGIFSFIVFMIVIFTLSIFKLSEKGYFGYKEKDRKSMFSAFGKLGKRGLSYLNKKRNEKKSAEIISKSLKTKN
jgi:hypothetical protein